MSDPTPLQERLWEAVAEVRDQHPRVFNDAPTDDVVAAVLPIIAAEVQAAKAEALRDAADAWHAENHGTMPRPYRWMWDRADTIEKGDGQ